MEDLLTEISQKLDMLITIVSIQGKTRNEQVDILSNRGMAAKEIGQILGMSEVNVRQVRWANKRR